MRRLIVINGVMGVGKSTRARALCDLLQPSFFLDGDWCWSMSPFNPIEADKRMFLDNIAHLLRSFLLSDRPYVVFCWVLHEDAIWSSIATELEGVEFETYRFPSCEIAPNTAVEKSLLLTHIPTSDDIGKPRAGNQKGLFR